MEFKKVTISLPGNLYKQGMTLIERGLFSNFSDLVRSRIRTEFKEIEPVIREFDYDVELIAGVRQSMNEAKSGKGKIVKTKKGMDKYFEAL